MTDSFIEVEPSGAHNRVKVKTELLSEREIPVYIQAKSDGTLIDASTEATLAALLAELQVKADPDETQSITNFYLEVQKGNIAGHSIVHKYGRNPNSTINAESTVSDLGDMQFPTTATTLRIKAGGNAADTAAGAGAREVTFYGLDETGALAEEAVATNGASASLSTTTTFLRIFRARVTDCGTYMTTGLGTNGANQGVVTIENTAGTADFIQIPIYEGSTEYAGYHVPLGKTAYMLSAFIKVDATKSSDVILYSRQDILNTATNISSRRVGFYFDGISGEFTFNPQSAVAIPALTDIWWAFIPSANGTECGVNFELLLVDD